MKHLTFLVGTIFVLAASPLMADELLGEELIDAISGRHFDCMMGLTPLEWIVQDTETDSKTIPYSAIVRGKTVDAEYEINADGRLTSDGYGDERWVTRTDDGKLSIARSDGRVMECVAR